MAAIPKQYTFSPSTTIESAKVNVDFDDIYNFVRDEVIQRDGSKAFTTHPTGPSTDPGGDFVYANKRYVDKLGNKLVATSKLTTTQVSALQGSGFANSMPCKFDFTFQLNNVSLEANTRYRIELEVALALGTSGMVLAGIFQNGTRIQRGTAYSGGLATDQEGVVVCSYNWLQGGAVSGQEFMPRMWHITGGAINIEARGSATAPGHISLWKMGTV